VKTLSKDLLTADCGRKFRGDKRSKTKINKGLEDSSRVKNLAAYSQKNLLG
jgi:hypothetical protein